jgi:hypothetical protein
MRFIKRLALNKKEPANNRFAVEANDQIVTTSKVALQLPAGDSTHRPENLTPVGTSNDGQIRFNTDLTETEIWNPAQVQNVNPWEDSGWERVKTNRQGVITPQDLGVGDGVNSLFGPLSYNIDITQPQNILVFIENVYQTPTTNYKLVNSIEGYSTSTTNASDIGPGDTLILLTTLTNILVGMTVSGPPATLSAGTTVQNVNHATRIVTISPNAIGFIPSGSTLTFSETSARGQYTFINFTSEVPYNKPVFALLGFDGYGPPP